MSNTNEIIDFLKTVDAEHVIKTIETRAEDGSIAAPNLNWAPVIESNS